MKKELTSKEVKFSLNLTRNKVKGSMTTIPEIDDEYEKIKRAINIKKEGYNLYLIDTFSKEKLKKLEDYISEQYIGQSPPKDICYITLEDIKKPEVLFVDKGRGNRLKDAVEELRDSYIEVIEDFYNDSSDEKKDKIIDDIQSKRTEYINDLTELAKKEEFEVKVTSAGFAFIPLLDGKGISEKEYDKLDKDKKENILNTAAILKKEADIVLLKLKDIETNSIDEIKEIYSEFLKDNMKDIKEEILLEFIDDDDVYEYLNRLVSLMEKEIIDCYTMEMEDDEEALADIINKCNIYVLVDNSTLTSPPVIYEDDPSINNLLGFIEYENHNGVYTTDASLINAGSILKANGGCIIIRVNSLANNINSYYHLKKVLMSNKVTYDISRSYVESVSINGLKPEAIPIDVKVILIGDQETYDVLYSLDEDFGKLFHLRAEFDPIVNVDENSTEYINNTVDRKILENKLLPITKEGLNELLKYLSRNVNSRNKINIDLLEIERILILSDYNARQRDSTVIDKCDIFNIGYKMEKIEEDYDKLYKDNKILISVTGEKVGVINGLAVLDTGYHSFGKPMRITCIAHKGSGRIVDIQSESKMSGKIHEKSISILQGLLSNIIDPYEELPIDFYISFEQTYGLVDGDSASVAETICILSALSKRPIKQSVAVTGSLNQLGEVQAIGGVNEKVEGFFRVCEFLDDVKGKGVLIPSSNKDELILISKVEEAIEKGEFHIYTMDNLNDAIEVLLLDENESIEDFYTNIKLEIEKYR